MAQAQGVPADGYETALAWEGQGGGDPARHCAAVALIGLGKYEEAATQLESLGSDLAPKKPELAAEAFGQAGQAWTSANQPAKALAVQNAGLKLAPDDVDLLVDRAFTQKSLNEFAKALDEISNLLRISAAVDNQLAVFFGCFNELRIDLGEGDRRKKKH